MFLRYALKASASISRASDGIFGGLLVRGYKSDFFLSILFSLSLSYSLFICTQRPCITQSIHLTMLVTSYPPAQSSVSVEPCEYRVTMMNI